jgi:ABC-type branched-subunit amino acid transport system substrate-binding protein
LLFGNYSLVLPASKDVIKIGQTCSLAGGIHEPGIGEREGAKIACDEINKAGGLFGKKLTSVFRDNESKPEKAVTQAKELCIKENIDFAIAGILSSTTRATSAIYQRHKIPALLCGAMATEIMEMGNPYFMRVIGNNTVNGRAMASAVKMGHFKRPSIIYLNDFFGQSLRKIMHEELAEVGLEVVSEANFDMFTPDFGPHAMKILSANPDVILLIAYGGDAIKFCRAAKGQGYTGALIGYSGMGSNGVRGAGAHDVDGCIVPVGGFAQGFYGWDKPGFIPLILKLEAIQPSGKYENVNAPKELDALDGYTAVMTFKKMIEAAGEKGLEDKNHFMEVASKLYVDNVAIDVFFPYGKKRLESFTVDRMLFKQYVDGHLRLWKHEPKCIETFEATRCRAEEEIFAEPYETGVTYPKFLKRWQQLLKENEEKVIAEVDQKLDEGVIRGEYGFNFKKAFNEILNYDF